MEYKVIYDDDYSIGADTDVYGSFEEAENAIRKEVVAVTNSYKDYGYDSKRSDYTDEEGRLVTRVEAINGNEFSIWVRDYPGEGGEQ